MRTKLAAMVAATSLVLAVMAACGPAGSAGTAPSRRAAKGPGQASGKGPCGTLANPPAYKHVIWVWLENRSYHQIIGSSQAPYLNSLAAECGLATNYHNISHPSLPNYIAATSGLGYSHLVKQDCDPKNCAVSAPSIFGQVGSWKAYVQSMPSPCYPTSTGEYAVRHNPPPYYKGLTGCAKRDVTYPHLAGDLADKRLPAFSFITPNLTYDMHDGTVAQSDAWLAKQLPQIFASPQYRNGSTAVFVVWDEGTGGSVSNCAVNTTDTGCHVAMLVISPSTPVGTRSATLFNHYSLLGTAEQLLGLRRLGKAADFKTMISAFHL